MTKEEREKIKQIKELFYTNLTSFEIQDKLNITVAEYNKLLQIAKKELGIPTKYRRIPSRLNKYEEGKYFIARKTYDDDFKVIEYIPTLKLAEKKLSSYNDKQKCFIEQATKENMLHYIEEDYFNKNKSWNSIMIKFKLNYHCFYELLNEIKEEKGLYNCRSGKNLRYIYPYSQKCLWIIRKTFNGEKFDYGPFENIDVAIKIRDYLESIGWDNTIWNNTKEKIVEEVS